MPKRPTTWLTIAIVLSALWASAAAQASPRDRDGRFERGPLVQNAAPNRSGVTLDQAVEQVRRQTGGRVLSAETVDAGGRRVHRIKVLTPDQRVRVVTVDAGR
ncbi:MAG: hypothetical protein PHQ14_14525 [Chromatiales bacterium]|nr:hypothetical protein [Chromatiales bacterium]